MNPRSRQNLVGVHADLVRVVELAETKLEPTLGFVVTEGLRSAKRQQELFAAGASRIASGGRHQTGHAVDLMATVAGTGRWDWPLYEKLAAAMKAAAAELKVSLVWGGDWKSLKDGPHFELDKKVYPA